MNLFNTIGDALGTILGFILWFFFDLFDSFVPAVFIFVVIIKAISFPFELKTRKAMLKNAKISVKTQEIQKKYANNRQKLNEEL
ncbi:MAG: YidC/Oxa1 family membrane protein insertase, partial [Bacilli bacterium]